MKRLLFTLLLILAAGPVLAYDFEITGLELNQTIQNLDNDMPLVLGRRIFVRAHARETTGVAVPAVTARIDYSVSYAAAGGLGGGGFGGSFTAEAGVVPGGAERTDYYGAFNFVIEPSIPDDIDPDSPASIDVTVTVNPDELGVESDPGNNALSVTRSIWVADKLHIHYVPVHLHEPSPDSMTPVDPGGPVYEYDFLTSFFNNLMISASALRWHPVALDSAGFSVGWESTPVFPIDHNSGVEWNLHAGSDRTAINSQLKALRDMSGWPTSWIIYGMVDPQAAAGPFAGWANNGVAWGVMNANTSGASPWRVVGGDTLAHEIGHRRGLAHMPCNGNESSGGGVDGDYPWPLDPPWSECSLAEVDPDGYYGVDPYPEYFFAYDGPIVISNDPSIAQPNRGFPMMGYRSPRWISPYEYCKLLPNYGVPCGLQWPDPPGPLGGITSGSGTGSDPTPGIDQVLAASEHVWVGGVLDLDLGRVSALPSYSFGGAGARLDDDTLERALKRRRDNAETGFDTGWRIEVEDPDGQVLHQVAIVSATALGETCGLLHDGAVDHDHHNVLSVAELVPLPGGSSRIVYRDGDGRVVETLAVSANAPTVTFTSTPTPGATLGPASTFQWYGRDLDGDTLTYTVRSSTDGGETWNVLALSTSATLLTLDAATLQGLPAGPTVVQVLVTDGVRSAVAEAGTFSVANQAPTVAILAAEIDGDFVVLSGFATDREDATLDGLSWSSDLDGPLGTGKRLRIRTSDLTPGSHQITLEARDSAGSKSSDVATLSTIATLDPATLASLKPSDMITQQDVESSAGGYKLTVPGVGEVYVEEIRAPEGGKGCQVHEPSLIDLLTADPPREGKQKWLQVTIYECPWGGTCCLGPLGGGCYILIKK